VPTYHRGEAVAAAAAAPLFPPRPRRSSSSTRTGIQVMGPGGGSGGAQLPRRRLLGEGEARRLLGLLGFLLRLKTPVARATRRVVAVQVEFESKV
jgi:hypothetical protein